MCADRDLAARVATREAERTATVQQASAAAPDEDVIDAGNLQHPGFPDLPGKGTQASLPLHQHQ
jgi:hypothetical protein